MELRFILVLFAIIAMISSIVNISKYYYNNKVSNKNNKDEESNITDTIKEEGNLTNNVEKEEEINTDKSDINTDKSEINTDKSEINTDKSDISTDKSDISTDKSEINTDIIDINTDKIDISTDKSDINTDIIDINTDNFDDLKDIDYFIATYKSQKGKKIKAFNPLAVLINDSQYYLTYLEDSKETNSENIRNLENAELEMNITNSSGGYFDSPKDGFIKIKVYFLDPLPSLDFLFYDCNDLINIDLSHLNTTNMSRISYTFYNCKNVEQINFTSLDTSNTEYMEFLFAGCENLVDIIGFENLNTSLIKYTTGMFFDCKNLQIANLSSFDLDSVEEQHGMFVNTESLQIVNLGNCTDANNLFDKSQEYNLIILGNEDINTSSISGNIEVYNINETNNITELLEELSCVTGKGEKCYYCDMFDNKKCGGCNYGYYLPQGKQYSKTKCKKCDEGCFDCYAEENSDISICTGCDWDYNLFNGTCIEYCNIDYDSNCLQCKSELEGKNNECLLCYEGYYIDPNYSKKNCKKIEIENCINATVEDDQVKCLNCSEGYMLHENKCYETCKTGTGKKCKACNPSFENRLYCESCNKYYYLFNGTKTTECKTCNNSNYCSECEYIAGEEVCTRCYDDYVMINGTCFRNCNSDCKNCFFDGINHGICIECKDGLYLKNYKEYDYIYDIDSDSTEDFLFSDIVANNTNITIRNYTYGFCYPCPSSCKTCFETLYDEYSYYCFSCLEGYNLVNYECNDMQCYVSDYSCKTCDKNEKNKCASCNEGYYLNKTTGKCQSCNINNCIECNEKKECLKCKENYELYSKRCAIGCRKGLNEKCKECSETWTEKCGSCNEGYFLPTDVDPIECKKCPQNCIECSGTRNNITCTKCETSCYKIVDGRCVLKDFSYNLFFCLDCEGNSLGCEKCKDGYYLNENDICYPCGDNIKKCHEENNNIIIDQCFPNYTIIDNKCLAQCETGIKEKCLYCKTEFNKINQCGGCNKGYYMPTDYIKQDICFSCDEEGCVKCSGTMSEKKCIECHKDFMLFEEKCIKNCEIGEKYKCLTCNEEEGKNDRCGTCNEGYYLPDFSTDINKNYICQECPKGCYSCYLDGKEIKCTECLTNYILKKDQCIEGCEFMKNCLNCEDSGDYPRCINCIEGFYFPKDLTKYYDRCYRCSIPGCKICEGDYEYNDICLECKSGFEPQMDKNKIISCSKLCDIGNNNKCKSCSLELDQCGTCNDGFDLEGGMCLLKDYDIVAEYVTQSEDNYIQLLNSNCIKYMNFDGVDYKDYPFNFIYASSSGVHKAFIKLKSSCNYPYLFANNKNLKYIAFFDNFNSLGIDYMNEGFFNSPNLETVDMSNLNLGNNKCFMNYFANDEKLKEVKFPRTEMKNAYYLNGIFKNCKSITSIDMSNIYNDNAQYTDDMFNGCTNIQSIKINKFKNIQLLSNNFLNGLPEKGTIIISKEIENSVRKKIPKNWIIEVE